MAKIITYECDKCGCEVTVRETPETRLSPIYCCGMEVTEVPFTEKKPKPKNKAAKKKLAKKKVVKKKK